MSKRLLIFLVVCILVVPSFLVSADVVWSNSFLEDKRSEMISSGRNWFVVNSDTGSLKGQRAPDPDYVSDGWGDYWETLGSYTNGQTMYLSAVYKHNDEYWGIDSRMNHGGSSTGWYPMDQLLVMYDDRDFAFENKDKFYEYTDGFSFKNIGDKLVTWQWPGSNYAKRSYTFIEDGFTQAENDYKRYEGIGLKSIKIYCVYKDEDEREWGYVEIEADISVSMGAGGYRRQITKWITWICLGEPSNTDIPAFNPAPEPVKWTPEPALNYNILEFYDGVVLVPEITTPTGSTTTETHTGDTTTISEQQKGNTPYETGIRAPIAIAILAIAAGAVLVITKKKNQNK